MLIGITSLHRSSHNKGAPFPTLLQTSLTSLSYFAHPLISFYKKNEDYYMDVISSDLPAENATKQSVRGIRPESKCI